MSPQVNIETTQQEIDAAQIAFEGVKEEATLGARTTLDVLNAEQDLLDARASQLSAEATRYVGVYQLLASMGLLTVEHLKLGIPTYDPAAYYNAVRNAPDLQPAGQAAGPDHEDDRPGQLTAPRGMSGGKSDKTTAGLLCCRAVLAVASGSKDQKAERKRQSNVGPDDTCRNRGCACPPSGGWSPKTCGLPLRVLTTAASPEAATEKLVLTPAFRIVTPNASAPEPDDTALSPALAAIPADAVEPMVVDEPPLREDFAAALEAAVAAQPQDWDPDGSEQSADPGDWLVEWDVCRDPVFGGPSGAKPAASADVGL